MTDADEWKADVWILPTCQRLHAAVAKARPRSEEADEEITTEGTAEPNEPTNHVLSKGTETGGLGTQIVSGS